MLFFRGNIMSSLFFYLILLLVIFAIVWLFLYQRKQTKKRLTRIKKEPTIKSGRSRRLAFGDSPEQAEGLIVKESAYDPNVIVLQIKSFPGKPYMGYELLQTLLSVGLHFGDMNIFHRYDEKNGEGNLLFSIAAATPEGSFPINDMGSFECVGLVAFMKMEPKQKLMARFDLMLDIARQLIEELGGEIYDDMQHPINVAAIRRLREKICTVETNNLYAADLLDNLD
jgi:cell division protein ZipA